MNTLTFNHRDELIRIKVEDIVCFLADGNYTTVILSSKKELLLSINLLHVQKIIEESLIDGFQSDLFVRLGRSSIIRKAYIFSIQTLKGKLILKVPKKDFYYEIKASKDALRKLKESVQNRHKHIFPKFQLRDLQTRKIYILKLGDNRFGRKSTMTKCDQMIDNGDNQISRLHFNILVCNVVEHYEYEIIDLGSSNGTFLNGIKLPLQESQKIESGSIIRVGKTEFIVEPIDVDKTEVP